MSDKPRLAEEPEPVLDGEDVPLSEFVGGTYRVEWADGGSRETTLAAVAWYAHNYDDEAEVTAV